MTIKFEALVTYRTPQYPTYTTAVDEPSIVTLEVDPEDDQVVTLKSVVAKDALRTDDAGQGV